MVERRSHSQEDQAMALVIIWLVVIAALAAWHGIVAVLNPLMRTLKHRIDPTLAILASIIGILTAGAIALAVFVSLGVAILAISLFSMTLGAIVYFKGQRFADPTSRFMFASTRPLLLPSTMFISFASSVIAFVIFTYWFLFVVPIALWFAIGFLSAEVAIRQQMRRSKEHGSETDRKKAIFAINDNQGRRGSFGRSNRYPFP
jgi:hypothetical protein